MHLLKLAHPCIEMSIGVMSDLVGRVGKFKQVFARGLRSVRPENPAKVYSLLNSLGKVSKAYGNP